MPFTRGDVMSLDVTDCSAEGNWSVTTSARNTTTPLAIVVNRLSFSLFDVTAIPAVGNVCLLF